MLVLGQLAKFTPIFSNTKVRNRAYGNMCLGSVFRATRFGGLLLEGVDEDV